MNNEENDYTIYCPRCGAEMKSSSRYCMKCGNLNYDHTANENMRPFIKEEKKSTYQVGSGKFLVQNSSNNQLQTGFANNTGNKLLGFMIPYGLYIILILVSLYFVFPTFEYDFEVLLKSNFSLFVILFSVLFLYIYSFEVVFMKCNRPWWASLIPFYNCFIMADIAFHNKMLGFICFIPIIGQVFLFIIFYQIGKKFQYNALFTAIFPIIMLPVIAYGSHGYEGRIFVTGNQSQSIERDYKYIKMFFATVFLFFVIGIGLLTYANLTKVKETSGSVQNYYYVFASRQAVSAVKKAIEKDNISCSNVTFSKGNGEYYFYMLDLGDYSYLPFYFLRDPITAYVKVVYREGVEEYYVSLSDGTYGLPELVSSEVSADKVIEMKDITFDSNVFNQCNISH